MLTPGIYVAGRAIKGTDIYLNHATHQYIVLIPEKKETIKSSRSIAGKHYVILGAYNVDGYLRAEEFAQSDHEHFLSTIKKLPSPFIESANYSVCWITFDYVIVNIYKAFIYYRTRRGQFNEIKYPVHLKQQLDGDFFNSNSWARSCIFWGAEGKTRGTNDLPGWDLGRDRLIPKKYFVGPPFCELPR